MEYNPFLHTVQHNPFPVYRWLREEAPVYHNAELGFYALSRYQDVLDAHIDNELYLSSQGVTIEGARGGQPFLITKDPPEHTWHRVVVSRLFTPRQIGKYEPYIRKVCADLLDAHLERDGFDAVADFAIKLPLYVISELMGVPTEQRESVSILSDLIAHREESDSREGTTEEASRAAGAELIGIMAGVVREHRQHPGDDVVSVMISTPVNDGHGGERFLGDDELASRLLELAFAGHETVAKLIGNGVVALAWYPDQRRALAEDPSLLPGAVEEMLRWDPPSHYQGRWTSRDVTLHGVTIPADQRVILVTGSAGHDERRYAEPELFDITRSIDRHVSFGFGAHLCLGASLARLETRVAFQELLRRYPEYDLVEGGAVRQHSGNVRGLKELAIAVRRPAAVSLGR